jgi:hypothetical protein
MAISMSGSSQVTTAVARAGHRTSATRIPRRGSRRPLFCEALEERRLLTVGFDWAFALAPSVIAAGNQTGVADVALDASGNAYVFGGYELKSGTVDFDPGTLTTPSTTPSSSFVAKYSPNKSLLWVKELPGVNPSGGLEVVDNGGSHDGVYVAGGLTGDLEFAAQTLHSTYRFGIFENADDGSFDNVGVANVNDGDVLSITDRALQSITFEYDSNNDSNPLNRRIGFTLGDLNTQVVDSTIAAINAAINDGLEVQVHKGWSFGFSISLAHDVTIKDSSGMTPLLGPPMDQFDAQENRLYPQYWMDRCEDAFVAKLDLNGTDTWSYQSDWHSYPASMQVRDLVVSAGSVVVAGSFRGVIDLNPAAPSGTLVSNPPPAEPTELEGFDGYVLKLDAANGGVIGTPRQLNLNNAGHNLDEVPTGLTASGGSLYMTGAFNGGGIWKLNLNDLADRSWSPTVPNPAIFGGGVEGEPTAIAVAPNGELLVTGRFEGITDFNPDTTKTLNLTSTKAAKGTSYSGYSDDVFVARLATDGALKWARSFGGAYNDVAYDVATDGVGDGNVYTTGSFIRTADFDPGKGTFTLKAQTTSISYGFEAFVSKLDANGNFVWAGNMGGNGNFANSDDEGHGIAVDASGNIYAGGQFRGKGDFNPTSGTYVLDTGGGLSGFLLKLKQSSPLMASASGPESGRPVLTGEMDAELSAGAQAMLQESMRRWQIAGGRTDGSLDVDFRIADLPGTTLGLASGNTIWLDDDAAGWGWFIDATPRKDAEFNRPGNQGEQNRMDLLTVVMHELGHVLGYDHDEDGVMAATLAAGVRRTDVNDGPVASVDDVFHQAGYQPADRLWGGWLSEQLEAKRPWAKRRR